MDFNYPRAHFTTKSILFRGASAFILASLRNGVIYFLLGRICTSLIYYSLGKTLPTPLAFLQGYLISTVRLFTLENFTIPHSDFNFCVFGPLQIAFLHLISLDVNRLNVRRKIILCCSGSSFSEHIPRTLAPKLFLFANQQPASNPPTHLMAGER